MVRRGRSLPVIGLMIAMIVFGGRPPVQAANRQQAGPAKQTAQRCPSLPRLCSPLKRSPCPSWRA
jgi:hypothetical protein